MTLNKENEEKLINKLQEFFEKDDWNYPHSLKTAKYMKKICEEKNANEKILVTAAYLHDIGYAGLIRKDYTLDERIKAKKEHMEKGAEKAEEILKEFDYSQEEINEIKRLIKIHDKLKELKNRNDFLLAEADSLGGLATRENSSFNEKEIQRYLQIFKKIRIPLIKTNFGRKEVQKLLNDYKK